MDRLLITVDHASGRTHIAFSAATVVLSVRLTPDVAVELGGGGIVVGVELSHIHARIPFDRLREEFDLPEHSARALRRWWLQARVQAGGAG